MKFYVNEVTRYIEPVNNKTEEVGMYVRDDEYKAEILFHQKMASAMNNTNCAMELIYVVSELGVQVPELSRRYVNPATLVPTPEPELTPKEPENTEPTEDETTPTE